MLRRIPLALVTLSVAAAATPARALQSPATGTILVGPNVRVSLDGDFPHVETIIAAHPTDPKVLVGAAVTMAGTPLSPTQTTSRTYASDDGGYTWRATAFDKSHSPDPQLAFGPDGTVYFTAIFLPLYRSKAGGMPGTWEEAGSTVQGDHPFIAVDHTTGKRRGRVYISGHGNSVQAIDPGETMTYYHPVKSTAVGYPNTMSFNPLVLSDGSLFVPFFQWTKRGDQYDAAMRFVLSSDGGQTFGEPGDIFTHAARPYQPPTVANGSFINYSAAPQFALDKSVHRDRIYVAWAGTRSASGKSPQESAAHTSPRVRISYSDDRGKTWTDPVEIGGAVLPHSAQWLPMIAVNRDGTVAVAWLDTRDDPKQLTYHVYFTASADGGRTFLPVRRISSRVSAPYNDGNRKLSYRLQRVDEKSGHRNVQFESGYRRWADGGDYLGMAASVDGVFHPLWADARGGAHQLYTSRITVVAAGTEAPAPATKLVEADVTGRIELRVDPATFEKGIATFPIRLRNGSDEPVYGPLRVEVVGTDLFTLIDVGGRGPVRTVDYSSALGDLPMLAPGAVTDALLWRLRHDSIREVPGFNVRIIGRVPERVAPL